MTKINKTQVQLTNDASAVSKCSAISKNYFKDDFIQEFVGKKKSRASLINLGYYTRAVIINKLVTDFIEFISLKKFLRFQIISCGSGFDSLYWRLSEANLLSNSLFVEIDFPDVIQKKILLIKQSLKLRSFVHTSNCRDGLEGINKMNLNFYLLEADLSDLNKIDKLFNNISIDFDAPTLFLSECVITYMKDNDSCKLVKWVAKKFKNCAFLNYEQIHPDDGFGKVMLKHFDKLQSSLLSVSKYPDCKSHDLRYKNLGFKNSFSVSEWDAFVSITSEEERERVLSLELFDEFEEFHLKCVHYVIAVAGNGISSEWMDLFLQFNQNFMCDSIKRPFLKPNVLFCNFELFRFSYCDINGNGLVFGGSSRQSRSSKIYKIGFKDYFDIKEMKFSGDLSVSLDMVYGTVVYFQLNKVPFVCLYGGRTSPDKVWNNGFPLIFELNNDQFLLRLSADKDNPIARYRTSMTTLNSSENEALCWVFGGRTSDLKHLLSDFWQLKIKCDTEKTLSYQWKQYEKKNNNWPCSRMSHTLTACSKKFELFIVGGLTVNSSSALNDMWKWCCRSESWEKVQLAGKLLPRYGHTAHLKDDALYLVGGVNTLAGMQPGLARIDLKNLTVIEYAISISVLEPILLFNHASDLISKDGDTYICIFGGGGNCFSFGTYLNKYALYLKLNGLN